MWAGNERGHSHVQLAGLEGDVIALPSGSRLGGDLYALFSCWADRVARIILADCTGHGFIASGVATHLHKLLHKFSDLRDTAALLAALNDEFTLTGQTPGAPLRLTTVVAATFDRGTGEFTYAYAAHPRMMHWLSRESRWRALSGLEGLPMGFVAGEYYSQQSVRLDAGDLILVVSDGVTEVQSSEGEQLGPDGVIELANVTLARLPNDPALQDFGEAMINAIRNFHGGKEFEDDLTLLTLRRTLSGPDCVVLGEPDLNGTSKASRV